MKEQVAEPNNNPKRDGVGAPSHKWKINKDTCCSSLCFNAPVGGGEIWGGGTVPGGATAERMGLTVRVVCLGVFGTREIICEVLHGQRGFIEGRTPTGRGTVGLGVGIAGRKQVKRRLGTSRTEDYIGAEGAVQKAVWGRVV